MRLATIRTPDGTRAVRVDAGGAVETGHPDVGALLTGSAWRAAAAGAAGPVHPVEGLDYAPVVPRPGKIICVGLNYAQHIREMGRELPAFPTLFAKYPEALIGARDNIVLPAGSQAVDWEAELAVVIGSPARHADEAAAAAAIAGYSVPAAAWQAPVRTAHGRQVPASEVPWMRVREAWVHAADFAGPMTFADIPPAVAGALVGDIAALWRGRGDISGAAYVAADTGQRWGEGPQVVSAPLTDLLAWMTGRGGKAAAGSAGLPSGPPRWL